jgi:hypothetical protein
MGRNSDAHPVVFIIAIHAFELYVDDMMIKIIKRSGIVIDVSVVVRGDAKVAKRTGEANRWDFYFETEKKVVCESSNVCVSLKKVNIIKWNRKKWLLLLEKFR